MKNSKVVLITGCTNGIGLETAKGLAKKGYSLILIARNIDKLNNLLADLEAINREIDIDVFTCDFEKLDQVVDLAKRINEKYSRLDVLLNNAGMWSNKESFNEDGFEATWVVNYYAPYLLTRYLLPLLKKTASEIKDARILILGSEIHRSAKIDFDNFYQYSFRNSYAATKLADMIFASNLAKELKSNGITVNSIHPGVVATGLWDKLPKFVSWIVKKLMVSPEKGAQTSIYLTTKKELKETGRYWANSKISEPSSLVDDVLMQNKLEEFTRKELSKYID